MHALKQDHFCNDVAAAQAFLAADAASANCDVMDVWSEDGTLIIISADELPKASIDMLHMQSWSGEIEVYRAIDMLG